MSRPASLLAAITPQESAEFLPEPLFAEVRALPGRFEPLDTTRLTTADFHRALLASNPEVLLTCWKTPPLPAQLPPNLRYVCHLPASITRPAPPHHLPARPQI